jgi:hypothetical protein
VIILLDSGVLSLLCSSIDDISSEEDNSIEQCINWFYSLLAKGVYLCTSQISDYEVRREFIRINSKGLEDLDNFKQERIIDFLPLTTEVMEKAAQIWAKVRNINLPTADNKNIDADMIILAQWCLLKEENPGQEIFIATTNVKHLKIIAGDNAQEWENIRF